MEFSVTDNAGRKVAVKAHNWLFAIASGLRALEVDANTLTSVTCNYEPDGSIVVEAPGDRRWWVKSLGSQLPFDGGSLPPFATEDAGHTSTAPPPPVARSNAAAPTPVPSVPPNTKPPMHPWSPVPLERDAAPTAASIDFDETEMETVREPANPDAVSSADEEPTRPSRPPLSSPSIPPLPPPAAPAPPPPSRMTPAPAPARRTPPPASAAPPRATPTPPPPKHVPAVRSLPVTQPPMPVAAAHDADADSPIALTELSFSDLEPLDTEEVPTDQLPNEAAPSGLTAPRSVGRAIKVVVSARSELLEEEDSLWDTGGGHTPEDIVADISKPAPSFQMPKSSLIREETESLAERLFEASMDFIGAEREEACQIALDLVNEFVRCQASSIAMGTLNDRCLLYVAATGPVADKILGREQPFGKGLVGMCFDQRATVVVTDVKESVHHDAAFDEATGFDTTATLCVPILDDEGLAYGVIQLLNPTDHPFFDEDEEAVEIIARALAGALAFS